jgi:hypothetical protein
MASFIFLFFLFIKGNLNLINLKSNFLGTWLEINCYVPIYGINSLNFIFYIYSFFSFLFFFLFF